MASTTELECYYFSEDVQLQEIKHAVTALTLKEPNNKVRSKQRQLIPITDPRRRPITAQSIHCNIHRSIQLEERKQQHRNMHSPGMFFECKTMNGFTCTEANDM